MQVGTQRRSGRNYRRANEYIRSGKFGDIKMVEMSWNVNQPGRWRAPAAGGRSCARRTPTGGAILIEPAARALRPAEVPRVPAVLALLVGDPGPVDGAPDRHRALVHRLPHPRSVVANGGIYQWQDGRTNFDTMTAVFDYGPADDREGGFQVVYSSRMGNEAGGIKELYYSNGGMLDLDRNRVSAEGGLRQKYAGEMGWPKTAAGDLARRAKRPRPPARAPTPMTTDARAQLDGVRAQPEGAQRGHRGRLQHSLALCMTIAALHTGKRVTFDDTKQEVVLGNGKKGKATTNE